jgi:hypothetical protein
MGAKLGGCKEIVAKLGKGIVAKLGKGMGAKLGG